LDLLANGLSPEEIVEDMLDLELEDMRASLRFASRRLNNPASYGILTISSAV
jgi:uncharacterized protein (DUF433 family)